MVEIIEHRQGDYLISTDRRRLNLDVIHDFLRTSYWARNIPRETVGQAIAHSICYGVYHQQQQQVGFGRFVTDQATFAYLSDVFIVPDYQGQGLGRWLVGCMMRHPGLQELRRVLLATADAHHMYHEFDFRALRTPDNFMEIYNPDIYRLEKE